MNLTRRTSTLLAALSVTGLILTGCSGKEPAAAAKESDSVVVREQWVKAADAGMTAAFAELQNTGDADVHVVGASSPASSRMELHEMATGADGAMVMRPKEGGFVIPAGGTHVLAAGGDHLMLMDVTSPLTPGADAEFTLEFEDASSTTFTAQVRDFPGAQENYEPGAMNMDMDGSATPAPAHGG
ncbi:copper chaperone PCu(A)C [Rhodococcus sp. SBT000017]|uniref:copper chaperone PCu(A)C n=1 Tax=Rhodococcus sp. SBT000017 TaxID=1803385 RepID=UPI000EF8D5D5|nr:copper chaperone PCu(A)C [Rhodococcus sp. SBT000017]RMB77035.1 copper chaperone PCu(A)C [Rhodococcus sp. SBT000017]